MKKNETTKKLEALSDSLFVPVTDKEVVSIWGGTEPGMCFLGGKWIRDEVEG